MHKIVKGFELTVNRSSLILASLFSLIFSGHANAEFRPCVQHDMSVVLFQLQDEVFKSTLNNLISQGWASGCQIDAYIQEIDKEFEMRLPFGSGPAYRLSIKFEMKKPGAEPQLNSYSVDVLERR